MSPESRNGYLLRISWRAGMSEFKPKKDDSRAADNDRSGRGKNADSPKPHGDKLQHAVDEAAERPQKNR
jgi:hypothetical protein